MSLIKCPECGKEVSDKASTCPNCGGPLTPSVQNAPTKDASVKPQKKGHGCLIMIIVFLLISIAVSIAVSQGAKDMEKHPEKYDDSIAAKYIDVTNEESKNIDTVLESCGIPQVKNIEHDELLDNAHFDGETGYRITINDNLDNIILYLDTDKNVYNLKYADYDLYSANNVVATIQDYTFTTKEASDLQIKCQNKVKEVLKSPSTAKFPNIYEWGFSKEKNIVTVQGYVDSQNSFGAELRSKFQFVIDSDSDTIQSFIFDGQELIK